MQPKSSAAGSLTIASSSASDAGSILWARLVHSRTADVAGVGRDQIIGDR